MRYVDVVFQAMWVAPRNLAEPESLAAVLELAGHKAQAVPIVADEPLDESWSEPEAFDGCSTRGQARPGEAQPIHIVRKTSTQTRGVAA